jgi:hypothetical protein
VYVRRKGSLSFRLLKKVSTNSLGYWTLNSSTAGQYWQVRWRSPAGAAYNGPAIAPYRG